MGRGNYRRERGQAIVFFALALVALLGMAGLAVDGAFVFEHRRRVSTAADAVALAGARGLLNARQAGQSGTAIRSAIQSALTAQSLTNTVNLQWAASYTQRSGAVISAIVDGGAIPANASGVAVTITYDFNTFLAPVVGVNTLPANGVATAVYGPLGLPAGGDMFPLVVSQQAATAMQSSGGSAVIFGPQSGAFKDLPGAFGSVDLMPNGNPPNGNGNNCGNPANVADTQTYYWCHGTQHQIAIGDTLPVNTGALGNSLTDEVEYRATTRPVGLVPVYDISGGSGNNITYRIVGFLAVELYPPTARIDADGDGRVDDPPYNLNGRNSQACRAGFPPPELDRDGNVRNTSPECSYIAARFVAFYLGTGGIDSDAPDTGVYAINLIR